MKVSRWSQVSFAIVGLAMGGCLANIHRAQADPPRKKSESTPRNISEKVNEHDKWISNVLKQIQTIKPGMKRADLNRLFTTEGGIRGGITYVYRESPCIKVDFEFKRALETRYDKDGRVTSGLSPNDEILSVSNPYLQYQIFD